MLCSRGQAIEVNYYPVDGVEYENYDSANDDEDDEDDE